MKNTYNYLESVTADVIDYIRENIDAADYEDREALAESLNDDLWAEDSVTGNGSGSYTMNRAKAREYVTNDLDALRAACEDFCVEPAEIGNRFLDSDYEWMDGCYNPLQPAGSGY